MTEIPTFKGQVKGYNVPKLDASMELENNDMIYRGMASFADSTMKIAKESYAIEQEEKAKKLGAEAGSDKNLDLNQLPQADTRTQQIYNQAAVDSFATDFAVDGTRSINRLKYNNRENPDKFLTEVDSYIRGSSENIPDRYKRQIIYPLQVQAESAYNSLLNERSASIRQAREQSNLFNMEFMKNDIANRNWATDDAKEIDANNTAFAQYLSVLRSSVANPNSGIKAADATKKFNEARESIAYSFVNGRVRNNELTGDQLNAFYSEIINGRTGCLALDQMAPVERAKFINSSSDIIKAMDDEEARYDKELDTMAGNRVDEEENSLIDSISSGVELTSEAIASARRRAVNVSRTPEQKKRAMKIGGDLDIITPPQIKKQIETGKIDGTLNKDLLLYWSQNRVISTTDYADVAKFLATPLSQNMNRDVVKKIKGILETTYPEDRNGLGAFVSNSNARKDYIEQNLKVELSRKVMTEDEIWQTYKELQKEARSYQGTENVYARFPKEIKGIDPYVVPVIETYSIKSNDGFYFDTKDIAGKQAILLSLREKYPQYSERALRIEANKILSILDSSFNNPELKEKR